MRFKKIVAVLCLLLLIFPSCNAKDIRVMTQQSIQYPGGQYAVLTAPLVKPGKVNLKYDITVDGKTNDQAVIDCVFKMPHGVEIDFLTSSGIQAINVEDSITTALTKFTEKGRTCYEFLIPLRENGKAHVEFQANISPDYVGRTLPIDCEYSLYKKPFMKRWGTAISIGAGIATGVVVGALTMNPATGAVAGTATGAAAGTALIAPILLGTAAGTASFGATQYVTYHAVKQSLQEIKDAYKEVELNSSYARFVVQVEL